MVKNSPADLAGIVTGDVLLEVNDIPVGNYNYEQMKNYFKQEGKIITVKILRNNRTIKHKAFQTKRIGVERGSIIGGA